MNVSLTTIESAAIRKALRTYLSDLRSEIVDTDNAQFKRGLREEQQVLTEAVAKLDGAADSVPTSPTGVASEPTLRVVELWWTTLER